MKKSIIIAAAAFAFVGCASNERQIQEALKKNPKLVFDVIEENPEQFIEVVNRAAQKAQQKGQELRYAEMKAKEESDLKNPKKPKLSDDRRLMGTPDAKITIVEYADFQCPACQMAYKSLNQFKEKYKDKIQFHFKHMPLNFHPMAMPAAVYFEAIKLQGKDKALKFYQQIFENQQQLNDEAYLKKVAKAVGADSSRLQKDVKSKKIAELIQSDMSEFENFGFTGTPVVLINGVALEGAQGLEALERVTKMTGGL